MLTHSAHVEVEVLRPVEAKRCMPVDITGKRHPVPFTGRQHIASQGGATHEPVVFLTFGDKLRNRDVCMPSVRDDIESSRGVYSRNLIAERWAIHQQRDLPGIVGAGVREHDLTRVAVPCHGEIHHAILRVLPDGLAGEIVRLARLEQGDHAGDPTQRSDRADDHIRDIPSVHDTNATNTNATAHTEAFASKEGEAK